MAGRDDLIDRYLTAVGRELERCSVPLDLDTLYLGGGTPSHLGPAGLTRLFAILGSRLSPVAGAEVSVVANPLDVTPDLVAALQACGVGAGGHRINQSINEWVAATPQHSPLVH